MRRATRALSRRLVACALLAACGSSAPPEPKPGCNPLIGDDCLTPFPSSLIEVADGTTPTGVHVALADSAMPVPHRGAALTADPINNHDGVSPSTPFVVFFAAGVDASALPALDQLDASMTPASPVQVLSYATGERVPVFAELDANAMAGDRQALIIRPMVRLQPATRYVIALVGLHDAGGRDLDAPGFAALRDRGELSHALSALAPRYEEIFTALAGAGVARKDVTLAWDVITASEHDLTGHLVSMRDQALPLVGSLAWTITSITDTPGDPHRAREIVGTFEVPSFLSDDSMAPSLLVDDAGTPRLRDTRGSANFVVNIPTCAATRTGPLPVMVFGHGLFGNTRDELGTMFEKQLADYLCMVQVGTDWSGLATGDTVTLANVVLPDLNQLHILTDRLQQAHVNAQVLTRLFLTRMKDDPAFQGVTDGSTAYYYGNSDGGIQGGTFMGLSQDVTRAVLGVPGSGWSTMMFRSFEFGDFKELFEDFIPDRLDQELLLALVQPEMDAADPANFAPHLLADPLPATPAKHILVQEAIGDAQVPNIATRVLARTIGLPGLDLEQPVFGIPQQAGPLASAYTQWDVTPSPMPPAGNIIPSLDNGAHEAVRRLVPSEAQLEAFFTPDGMATQTCSGPCTCDLDAGTCAMPDGVWPPE